MSQIYDKAASYLSRGNRSEKEVRDYLKKQGFSDAEVGPAIAELQSFGYIDDAAYSKLYARYGAQKGWGMDRIYRQLAGKGISREVVEEALSQMEEEGESLGADRQRAMAMAQKILAGACLQPGEEVSQKLKARVARRLSGYGYSSQIIYDILGRLGQEEAPDEG